MQRHQFLIIIQDLWALEVSLPGLCLLSLSLWRSSSVAPITMFPWWVTVVCLLPNPCHIWMTDRHPLHMSGIAIGHLDQCPRKGWLLWVTTQPAASTASAANNEFTMPFPAGWTLMHYGCGGIIRSELFEKMKMTVVTWSYILMNHLSMHQLIFCSQDRLEFNFVINLTIKLQKLVDDWVWIAEGKMQTQYAFNFCY